MKFFLLGFTILHVSSNPFESRGIWNSAPLGSASDVGPSFGSPDYEKNDHDFDQESALDKNGPKSGIGSI